MLVPADHDVVPAQPANPADTLLEYLQTVRVTDVRSAACHLFDVDHPRAAHCRNVHVGTWTG